MLLLRWLHILVNRYKIGVKPQTSVKVGRNLMPAIELYRANRPLNCIGAI